MQEISRLRVIFAGTPTFAETHLQALLDSPHQVVAVYCQPDRPAGRGKKLQAGPVKALAQTHHLPIYQPESLKNPETQAELAALNADVMVVVAYGLILPKAVLALPRLGCINVHASLLPRWRGAAPIQRAIEAGDTETGVTVMQMDEGLDTGPMLAIARCPIENNDTSASLFDKLAALGSQCLIDTLNQLETLTATPQDHQRASYAAKISKAEAALDWRRPATELARQVRAFNPFPIAYTELADKRLKIHRASVHQQVVKQPPGTLIAITEQGLIVACGQDCLCLEVLQLPGKKAMTAHDLLLGHRDLLPPGTQFHPPATEAH